MKILVMSAGGSCPPLITSIRQNKPDLIHFLCSEGSEKSINGKGKVCGKDPKNPDQLSVLSQCNIPENEKGNRFFIHRIENIDDLNSCYTASFKILNDIQQKYPKAEIVVDYTGGTKSMTGGLAAASFDFCGIKHCVVKGDRPDLVKVLDGTERIKVTGKNFSFLNRQLEQARKLIDRYDYEGVQSILEETFTISEIPEDIDKKIQRLYTFSKAFLAWDRFDHIEAWKFLNQNRKISHENVVFLETVLWSRKKFDEKLKNVPIEGLVLSPRGCGYELVEDLVLNAERRASQGRYDDAVGRLYRAFEMLVQMRLRDRYSIDNGNVDLEKLPENLRVEYEARKEDNGKIVLGLRNSYELLSRLDPEDELGKLYAKDWKRLTNSLTIRNESLYAHGMSPISKAQYEKFYEKFVNGILDPFLKTFGKKYALRTQFASADKLLEKL